MSLDSAVSVPAVLAYSMLPPCPLSAGKQQELMEGQEDPNSSKSHKQYIWDIKRDLDRGIVSYMEDIHSVLRNGNVIGLSQLRVGGGYHPYHHAEHDHMEYVGQVGVEPHTNMYGSRKF